MADPTNEQRAEWAKSALATFVKAVDGEDIEELYKEHLYSQQSNPGAPTPFEDNVSDLIKDLLHLLHIAGCVDIPGIFENARHWFQKERDEP
jgi:hypothetical protein